MCHGVVRRAVAPTLIHPVWLFGRPGSLTWSHPALEPRTGRTVRSLVSGRSACTRPRCADPPEGLANASCARSKATSCWVGFTTRSRAAMLADVGSVHVVANRASNGRSMNRFRLVRLVPFLILLCRSARKADVPGTWGGRADVPCTTWVRAGLKARGRLAVMLDGLTVLARGHRASGESDRDCRR
jgi:hypothetical protein